MLSRFESVRVRELWWPIKLRCLIIGESPGEAGSPYFYDPIRVNDKDQVKVRKNLLTTLAHPDLNLISKPTLESFRDAGFVFDHAIRMQYPMKQINHERQQAQNYTSQLAIQCTHLSPSIEEAQSVWVMGLIARNAVASLYPQIPREKRKLTPPYRIEQMPKLFVSRYLSRISRSTC